MAKPWKHLRMQPIQWNNSRLITKAAKLVDLGFLVPARGKTMPCDQEQSEQQGCAQHRAQQYDLVAGQVNIACDDSV